MIIKQKYMYNICYNPMNLLNLRCIGSLVAVYFTDFGIDFYFCSELPYTKLSPMPRTANCVIQNISGYIYWWVYFLSGTKAREFEDPH